jgi:hypothetical protein
MIAIRQKGNKYRLEINGEEWELDTREEMQQILDYLLNLKESRGKIKSSYD